MLRSPCSNFDSERPVMKRSSTTKEKSAVFGSERLNKEQLLRVTVPFSSESSKMG
jgi:hypothetical protein